MLLLPLLFLFVSLALAAKKDVNEDFNIPTFEESHEEMMMERHKEEVRRFFKERENFTTCTEFVNNTKLDVNKVLDVEWQVIYYYLSKELITTTPHIFHFRLTDPTLLSRFKSELSRSVPHAESTVNWTAAELFMDSNIDVSVLLLATNQSGIYDVISAIGYEGKIFNGEDYHFSLRFIEPHFLGLMNCVYRQLLVMAPVDKLPKEEEEESIANLFKFRSNLGLPLSEVTKALKAAENQTKYSSVHRADDRNMELIYEDENPGEAMAMI